MFARSANRFAVSRVTDRAQFERYLRAQRIWGVAGAVLLAAMIMWITTFIMLGAAPVD